MNDNVIYIGNKPTMNYVLAAYTQALTGTSEIVFKARGNANNRMLNAVAIFTRLLCPEWKVQDIQCVYEKIGTGNASVMALYIITNNTKLCS